METGLNVSVVGHSGSQSHNENLISLVGHAAVKTLWSSSSDLLGNLHWPNRQLPSLPFLLHTCSLFLSTPSGKVNVQCSLDSLKVY